MRLGHDGRHGAVLARPLMMLASVALLIGTVSTAAAQVDYSRRGDTVVIRMQEVFGEGGDGPSIEVRGNGTTHVRYPAFMKRAGEYTTHLDASEMDRLVGMVADGGLLSFDAATTDRAKDRASRAASTARAGGRPTRHVMLDGETTILEINVGGVKRTIRWTGLRSDAHRFPGVAAIQGLAQAQRELQTHMERGDLTRVTR